MISIIGTKLGKVIVTNTTDYLKEQYNIRNGNILKTHWKKRIRRTSASGKQTYFVMSYTVESPTKKLVLLYDSECKETSPIFEVD